MTKAPKTTEVQHVMVAHFEMAATADVEKNADLFDTVRPEYKAILAKFTSAGGKGSLTIVRREVPKGATPPPGGEQAPASDPGQTLKTIPSVPASQNQPEAPAPTPLAGTGRNRHHDAVPGTDRAA